MSNFTPLVEKEYIFEGDTVTVKFSRMKRKHMLAAMPAMKKMQAKGEIDLKDFDEDTIDFIDNAIDHLPEYVKEIDGLKDKNGDRVGLEAVVDDFYFLVLAMDIAMDLITESTPLTEGN